MQVLRMIRIGFYGSLAEAIGREIEVQAPDGSSIAELRERIAAAHPHAAHLVRGNRVRALVGDAIVTDDRLVGPGETVEFFPPVSGG